MRKFFFVTLIGLLAAVSIGCNSIDDLNGKKANKALALAVQQGKTGQVVFGFGQAGIQSAAKKSNMAGTQRLDIGGPVNAPSASAIIVTILDGSGNAVYSVKSIPLVNMYGSYISEPIALVPGSYSLTQFIVVDANGNALYVAPLVGSPQAYLVDNPLAISFTVATGEINSVTPEVLKIEGDPLEYGYETFQFNIVNVVNFLTGVVVYNQSAAAYELTSADVLVSSGGTQLYRGTIEAATTEIKVRDGYATYDVKVSKEGYPDYTRTFTNAELKAYSASPLVINLEPIVYAAGLNINSSGVWMPGWWKNGVWVGVGSTENCQVNSLVVSGSDVYIGGYTTSGGVKIAAGCKNGGCDVFSSLDNAQDSEVSSLVVSGSDIYAGGYSRNSAGIAVPGYWHNGTWVGLTPPDPSHNVVVTSLVVSGTDVYATANDLGFWGIPFGSGVPVPGYWKNGEWNALPSLDPAHNSAAQSILVSGSDVYVGGFSRNSSGVAVPGYWKNGEWNALSPLDPAADSGVNSLVVSGSDVYAGGFSTNSAGVPAPGYWKNGAWVGLTPLDPTQLAGVFSLVISGTDIYAGGGSGNSSGIVVPGYWHNGTWVGLTPLDPSQWAVVFSLALGQR